MKGSLLTLLSLFCTVQAASWDAPGDLFVSTGIGFAPIYIEEVTEENMMVAGATVTPLHVQGRVGMPIRADLLGTAGLDTLSYTDGERNIYVSSLLSVGVEWTPALLNGTRLALSGGITDKRIFGADLNSAGLGFKFGITRPLLLGIAAEAGYSFRRFSSVASLMTTGEAEYSSLITLGLRYRWQ